jgi:bacterioferritin
MGWSPLRGRSSPTASRFRTNISRGPLEDVLEGEEEHIDWLETPLELIGKIGLQNYQQSQM